jgi:hypothetical protein
MHKLTLSIFRQLLHVSVVSMPIIRRYNRNVYSNWYLLFFSDELYLVLVGLDRTTDSNLKRTISTNCCIQTVEPPDDGHRYARNMSRLTKYTKTKLCIKLVLFYTIILRCTIHKTLKK